jgi:beta-N-acetylhexosaminidase
VVQTLVREGLGFDGLLVTDDLEMGAIANRVGVAEAAVLALIAGADMPLICRSLALAEDAVDAICAAVAQGRLAEARVREAVARGDAYRAALPERAAVVVDAGAAQDAARAGIAVVRGTVHVHDGDAITVIDFDGTAVDGVIGAQTAPASLNAALRGRRRKSEVMRVALDPDDDDLDLLLSVMRSLSPRSFVLVLRRAAEHPAQRAAVERLLAAIPQAIVACVREPYDAALFPQARNLVCTFGDGAATIAALADAIVGRFVPAGRVPLGGFDAAR